jgi:hypothetical protein
LRLPNHNIWVDLAIKGSIMPFVLAPGPPAVPMEAFKA